MHKIRQSGWFLGRLLGPLLKAGLPLIRSLLKPLAQSFLIPLGLTAVASATDVTIHKKIFGIWCYNINNFEWRNEWHYENS